jgi:hypothetical protein
MSPLIAPVCPTCAVTNGFSSVTWRQFKGEVILCCSSRFHIDQFFFLSKLAWPSNSVRPSCRCWVPAVLLSHVTVLHSVYSCPWWQNKNSQNHFWYCSLLSTKWSWNQKEPGHHIRIAKMERFNIGMRDHSVIMLVDWGVSPFPPQRWGNQSDTLYHLTDGQRPCIRQVPSKWTMLYVCETKQERIMRGIRI